MIALSAPFWRIVFTSDAPNVLAGSLMPEGRFHHDGQQALYLSPDPIWAGHAVKAYVKTDDRPRVIVPVSVQADAVADLRDTATLDSLRLRGHEAAVPFLPERAAGRVATSWRASDAAREAGAQGMIFPARRDPSRWHLVLFSWNEPGGATAALQGSAEPWRAI